MNSAVSYLFNTIISVFTSLLGLILNPILTYLQNTGIVSFLEINSNYQILSNFFTAHNLGWAWNWVQFAYDFTFMPDGIFEMLLYYVILKNIIILANNAIKIFLQWYDTLKF